MVALATSDAILRKRLRRLLFDQSGPGGNELAVKIMPILQSLGDLALVGGAVRDVAREGVVRFKSDLDFVVVGADNDQFVSLMTKLSGQANRFGGYSLRFKRWKVDIWRLEDTWARTAGLRTVDSLADLLECTFFDWDAIAFDVSTGRVHARDDYYFRLRSGLLDLNLEENPNPLGSLVRALRRGALWQVYFGTRLSSFVRRSLDQHQWDEIVALDARAFSRPVLDAFDPVELRHRLDEELLLHGALVTQPFGTPAHDLTSRLL